ncbi:hypothetical protein AU196_03845 [Mycobacterium sp. IS-1742]|uniref:hypothetical protein n=1 Tax=Mycobacterium sp. IS-1742 TaxID=1772285 RepID=UPI00073FA9B1|nr:hypothetical protein [Mycobacterium sp. IS-1742]KUI29474.1 hypothetical protein AU196_03845 [Mycobacterium sp. IS-1742]
MITDYEDVPGANAAARAGRARQFAAMLLTAARSGDQDFELVANLSVDYIRAGFTPDDIAAARHELIRVYALDDRNPDDALRVLREIVEPVVDDSDPGDPGVTDYAHGDAADGAKYEAAAWFDDDQGDEAASW